VPPDANESFRETPFRRFGEINDFGDVRQIVAGESDNVGPPTLEHSEIGTVVLDLQIDQLDRVSGPPRRLGDEFEADRLEPQKDLGIMKHPGENAEKPHENPPLF
jgi:hypothetical protein